ncbi:Zinc finger protein 593 homolog-like Protein [Gryllus bimaculatus]|nr:Zinc finger protein 593 homolog-like Protein [Gryllus bimaculatus]
MTYKRKRHHKEDNYRRRQWNKIPKTKDLDQIDNDMKEENAQKLIHQEIDFDKPGLAQHYCLHCARYFIDDRSLKEHFRTKAHKRRLKDLETEPYTIEESERAGGLGSFSVAKKRKVETQECNSVLEIKPKEQKMEN